MTDSEFLAQAIALARRNVEKGGRPFGAVVVRNGEIVGEGVVCGRGRNPTLRLWPTIFSGKIDVFPGDRRSRLISSMTSVAPA